MTVRCRFCRHKSRHRNVAVGHVWRMHGSRINSQASVNLQFCDSTPSSISYEQTYTRCSSRPAAVISTWMDMVETPTVTDGSAAACPRSRLSAATSTTRSSDTDEDQFRPVTASADRTSADKSEMACSSGDLDLLGPLMNPVVPDRHAVSFQSWPGRWNSTWTSAGYQRAERNCLSPDWLCKTASSVASSSFSNRLPFSVDGKTLERSGMDSGYCTVREITGNASFRKQTESSHSKCRRSSGGSVVTRFSCPRCSLSYKRAADLNRHLKQKHWTSLTVSCSSSCLHATSFSTAREVPLNLALKDASSSQAARRKQRRLLCGDDTPQDLPLDLSTPCKTPRSNESGAGRSSVRPFDNVTDWRSSFSRVLPPFIFGDSVPKTCEGVSSKNKPLSCSSSAASQQVSAMPSSFYASFTEFMERTYKPLWKSYFDGAMGQNATAVRPENTASRRSAKQFDCQSVLGDDLKQKYRDRVAGIDKTTELSGPGWPTVDNNNNALKCDRNIPCTDVARPSVLTGLGSKDGGSWGQCPLCPFVCPHPLVMRRHLDVHDEPELQRTTHVRQTAAATCKTSFEPGAATTRVSFFDPTSSLNAGTSMAMFNYSTCGSTFAADSGGVGAGGVSLLTSSTPSWPQTYPLPAPYITTSMAGKSTSWNSISGLTATSAVLQTAHEHAVTAFPSTLPAGEAGRETDWRMYECSQNSERSRSATDVKEHVDEVHPAGRHVVTSAAKSTPPWLNSLTNIATPTQWNAPLPAATSIGVGSWWRGWTPNAHLASALPVSVNSESPAAAAAATFQSASLTFSPLSSRAQTADSKVSDPTKLCRQTSPKA